MAKESFVRSFDGTELFTRVVGEGPPVVLCDGLGCNGFIYRYLVPALQDQYQVVSWHYRGHGESHPPVDPNAVGVREVLADLLAVLDAHQLDRAVLMGHSMGVQISLDFALRHPQRVAGLVPMCGSYGRPLETFQNTRLASVVFPYLKKIVTQWPERAQWIWTHGLLHELSYLFATNVVVEGRLIKRPDLKPYFDHLAQMDVRLFFRMLDRLNHHSVQNQLHRIAAPTLIVAGERDTFTPVWLSRRMQRLISPAELLVVPFGTHAAPLEMPELVNLRIRQFLEERVYGLETAEVAVVADDRHRTGPVASPAKPRARADGPAKPRRSARTTGGTQRKTRSGRAESAKRGGGRRTPTRQKRP